MSFSSFPPSSFFISPQCWFVLVIPTFPTQLKSFVPFLALSHQNQQHGQRQKLGWFVEDFPQWIIQVFFHHSVALQCTNIEPFVEEQKIENKKPAKPSLSCQCFLQAFHLLTYIKVRPRPGWMGLEQAGLMKDPTETSFCCRLCSQSTFKQMLCQILKASPDQKKDVGGWEVRGGTRRGGSECHRYSRCSHVFTFKISHTFILSFTHRVL